MGSVIATWRAQCAVDRQNEFLPFMAKLAEENLRYKASFPTPLNPLSRKIRQYRSGGRPSLPPTRTFDQVVTGRVLLRTDILAANILDNLKTIIAAVNGCRAEIPPILDEGYFYFAVTEIAIKGPDFALFDAYRRYPGSDRLSFVFLKCPQAPVLDGRLVHVHDRDVCSASTHPYVRTADWVLECPYIHLRYTHEKWLDQLLSWTRYFFVPDLHYWRHDEMPNHAKWRVAYDRACRSMDRAEAIETTFADLLAAYHRETGRSVLEAEWEMTEHRTGS